MPEGVTDLSGGVPQVLALLTDVVLDLFIKEPLRTLIEAFIVMGSSLAALTQPNDTMRIRQNMLPDYSMSLGNLILDRVLQGDRLAKLKVATESFIEAIRRGDPQAILTAIFKTPTEIWDEINALITPPKDTTTHTRRARLTPPHQRQELPNRPSGKHRNSRVHQLRER